MESPRRKTVLITGCTPGGIGFALAKEFHSRGMRVIATARKASVLEELARQGMEGVRLEVDDENSIAACAQLVAAKTGGRLDILVNNAGRGLTTPALDTPLAEARAVYATNLFGAMGMVKSHAPLLLRARGLIVNISSVSALGPYPFGSAYSSSKAALAAYSRTLRQELRPFGVRVTVVMAGAVRSNMGAATKGALARDSLYARAQSVYAARRGFSQKETSRPMDTAEFARCVVDALLREEAGPVWRALGGGRPDWFWCGGMARLVYWGSWLGEWALDLGAWRIFGLREVEEGEARRRAEWGGEVEEKDE